MNKLLALLLFVSSVAWAQPKNIEVFIAEQQPAPTIVLAHACGGVNTHMFNHAQLYKSWGYNAIIVDSYTPRGYASCFVPHYVTSQGSERKPEIVEAAKWAKTQSWHKGGVALVGWSHGAITAIAVANDPNIKEFSAVAAYYPGCSGKIAIGTTFDNPRVPTLLFLGARDDWTPSSYCESATKPWFGSRSELYKVTVYPTATHVFDDPKITNRHGKILEHDPSATADSYQQLQRQWKQLL
jgi:dienelactone hydrolase